LQSINKDGIIDKNDKRNTNCDFIIDYFVVLILKNISIFYCILLKYNKTILTKAKKQISNKN